MTDEPSKQFGIAETRLVEAVTAFRNWADCYPVNQRSGEWECDYDEWRSITSAFAAFLDSSDPELWNASTTEMLLYILARDNEMEMLKRELITRPGYLLALARAALHSTERDARWQLADALGSVELTAGEVEPLLAQLFHDGDEYVSRRALLALARRRSNEAEPLAVRAWCTEHEYQRMAALEALSACRSPLLQSYLDLAESDGRQYLVNFANELRSKQACEENE
ncbi:HEAT repeat domain-containing protein [Bradyrhizobium stylosanthis]|uniref:HEAT repeat protein n=1 Tax=Bradyrhizobium stylosanthis TaxID=1803665 RepID=A0A560DB22_9BRAD|nr:HEAT repeat domain-containing protein [Bradyrhizobium stylosanthis]TWA94343.1 HEAT repeat protein [Bradyrhizobium stylosanthis]